jgi:hypothetical protein
MTSLAAYNASRVTPTHRSPTALDTTTNVLLLLCICFHSTSSPLKTSDGPHKDMSTSTAAPPRPDTTRSVRSAPSFRNSSIDGQRKSVTEDVRYKTEVSLDDFIKTFVPPFPEAFTITDVLRRVEEVKAWKDFSSSHATNKRNEDVVCKQLTRLFDEMVKAAQHAWKRTNPGSSKEKMKTCPKPRWSLITEPTATPNTPERPSALKPDMFFHCNEGSDSKLHKYHNIAFTVEFSGTANSFDVSPSHIFDPSSKLFSGHIQSSLYDETYHGRRCLPAFHIWHHN